MSSYLLWESVKYYLDDLVGGVKSVTPSSPKNWFVERGGGQGHPCYFFGQKHHANSCGYSAPFSPIVSE